MTEELEWEIYDVRGYNVRREVDAWLEKRVGERVEEELKKMDMARREEEKREEERKKWRRKRRRQKEAKKKAEEERRRQRKSERQMQKRKGREVSINLTI